jgi:hypothetical protein
MVPMMKLDESASLAERHGHDFHFFPASISARRRL